VRGLGLDPSLTDFGWAIHDTESPSRCVARGRFQTSARDLFIDRYCDMRESLRALVQEHGIVRAGVEYPVFKDLYSEGMYGLFLYTCEALRAEKVDTVFLSPMQVKAHARDFLGRPRVGGKLWKMMKGDMVEAAKADAGGKGPWNHNEADAYWVARTATRFWMLHDRVIQKADLTPAERAQFTSIHTYQRGKKAGETVARGVLYREDERFFRWTLET